MPPQFCYLPCCRTYRLLLFEANCKTLSKGKNALNLFIYHFVHLLWILSTAKLTIRMLLLHYHDKSVSYTLKITLDSDCRDLGRTHLSWNELKEYWKILPYQKVIVILFYQMKEVLRNSHFFLITVTFPIKKFKTKWIS